MTMDRILENGHRVWAYYFLCFALFCTISAQDQVQSVETVVHHHELEGVSNITCQVVPVNAKITWKFNDKIINTTDGRIKIKNTNSTEKDHSPQYVESLLTIVSSKKSDAGNYTCEAELGESILNHTANLDLRFNATFIPTKLKYYADASRSAVKKNVTMKCLFKTYYVPHQVNWTRIGDEFDHTDEDVKKINETHVESSYTIKTVVSDNNGTHECKMYDEVSAQVITGQINLIVYGDPTITIDSVIGINTTELYVNWTVGLSNSEVVNYTIAISNETHMVYTDREPQKNSTSFVITNLKPSTEYSVQVTVTTKHSNATSAKVPGKTLDEEPNFVPIIAINGFTATSVTVDWTLPPPEISHLIHYYLLEAVNKNGGPTMKAIHTKDSRNLPYMFQNLEPHSRYIFKVRACQYFTEKCWNWSEPMEAATLDGTPGKPQNVNATCLVTQLSLTWEAPLKPNGEIKGYMMELTGIRYYKDRNKMKNETWGPASKFMDNQSKQAWFDNLLPNAQYTVKMNAVTRTRRRGEEVTVECKTAYAAPDRKPGAKWSKFFDKENNRYLFQTQLTKVLEKNGPICCYRLHIVRLDPKYDIKDLKPPHQLDVIPYEESRTTLGSYITDIFTNDDFPSNGILTLITGDGEVLYNRENPVFSNSTCQRCIQRPIRQHITTTTKSTITTTEDDLLDDESSDIKSERTSRSVSDNNAGSTEYVPKDGPLDPEANYTFFIELIPGIEYIEPMYSEYQYKLRPAPSPIASSSPSTIEYALQATCAVAALLLLLLIIFCVFQSRRSRKLPPHAQLEMNPLQSAIHYMRKQLGGGAQRVPLAAPPDMPPIAKEDLAAAYAERHADSDYGFQKEFELLQMLSECFSDRTTHASEARENQPKNRYPDIKAYDQTRVKLSQIDGIVGTDYINANYVSGYKDPKKFICAQGPTDTTVNDFWRMIWEHGLELIIMLTNLEEYSKVKCSKYWPDELRGSRAFGNIIVQHVSEKRYSDYVVRELKISKQPTTADGQPIVENNGVAKRNGDIKEVSDSAPTSPRDASKDTGESRIVKQYHFLMWKDFAAPEHPHAILKFIKRVNEAWNNMVGRPVVVHCSAGVGRTGTLVALDCLIEQLRATGHVTVFNTIAELRRQRNFLVQSQKQYIFVYRALVEYAHYGDTEIAASKLKTSIDRLRNMPEGADKCLMEHEFEKMLDSPVVEAVKSCAAAQAEEVRSRNRNNECLPYDRNRVMLTPIPGRDYSTYINASFVEAYDNSEGYIITQDPLTSTIFDFWRMVSEQGVATIVMLSELGENKCPRYWDDGTVQYEHISVQYDESESCPYYTRRQFRVTNNKSGHVQLVRQLQYHGWPTAPGHVPEVTRGLAELADAAATSDDADDAQPMLVHCNTGTERSALFVALCILIAQLRAERRVDVSTVARKVRSQRDKTIDTFLQYEFLHRAILNYAELHNLLEDS